MQIAKKGIGTARPNPSVGAVIVIDNVIVGEGYTSAYGGNHAEVNAIDAVKDSSILKKATIYVTLEPCAHFGKTPPCANLIVKHRIKKVVIGCVDTNPLVSGKGIQILKEAGCEVITGVLEKECKEHHRRFFTFQHKKRPYIILKWAATKDGFIAPITKEEQVPVWITNTYSQQLVHKWRSEEHAILVGTNTVIADNPKLNIRSWNGKNPVRIVLDRNLRIPQNANVLDGSVKTIVVTKDSKESRIKKQDFRLETLDFRQGVIFEVIDFSKNLAKQVCEVLYKHKIQSLIIEGGRQTLQTFMDANLWDEARVFEGDKIFEKGVKAPKLKASCVETMPIKKDILKIYKND